MHFYFVLTFHFLQTATPLTCNFVSMETSYSPFSIFPAHFRTKFVSNYFRLPIFPASTSAECISSQFVILLRPQTLLSRTRSQRISRFPAAISYHPTTTRFIRVHFPSARASYHPVETHPNRGP